MILTEVGIQTKLHNIWWAYSSTRRHIADNVAWTTET